MAKNNSKGKYVYVTQSTLPEDFDVTRYDLWEGLKEVTSAHGIPHVTKARGKQHGTPVSSRTIHTHSNVKVQIVTCTVTDEKSDSVQGRVVSK